jgi:hypothetical protein
MAALDEFDTTLTLCFTPEHLGIVPHYTSPPKEPERFADFAEWMIGRYAPARMDTMDESARAAYAPETAAQ